MLSLWKAALIYAKKCAKLVDSEAMLLTLTVTLTMTLTVTLTVTLTLTLTLGL